MTTIRKEQREEALKLAGAVASQQLPGEFLPLVIFLLRALKGEIPLDILDKMIKDFDDAYQQYMREKEVLKKVNFEPEDSPQ